MYIGRYISISRQFILKFLAKHVSISPNILHVIHRSVPLLITADNTVNARIRLNTFFDRKCEFVTYRDSTTTPQCFQSVQWVIFLEPIPVTYQALSHSHVMSVQENHHQHDLHYHNRHRKRTPVTWRV